MNKEYKIKLDLNKKLYNKKMAFNQFDENVNDFYIEVTKNNEVVKDLDKSIVTLVAIKPNGEVDAQFIEVKEGQIYADLKPSMCDLVGNYQAKAMIVLEGEIVTTDTINYSVSEDKIISRLNDDVVSDERFPLFTDALARLSTIEITEEQRMINEAERILSEENRKIEEAKRVEAELIRQHEEADRAKYDATRESNENIRKQNESIRLSNETNRIDEESKRVEEENKRKLAEEERNANYNFMTEDEERRRSEANAHKEAENLRVQAETNRVNEEAKRRTTEQGRVSAENTRVSNENTREANEVARQSNEAQRIEAETQRQNRYNSFITEAEKVANDFETYTNNAKASEEERKANELDRKSQEDRRISNEVERISNENTRKANEVTREENETSRQDVFENKVSEVDEKISELNTTKDNFISSINTKVDNKISEIEVAKSDMTNTVSNKIDEVETRFNALTSKQQQDAEVIDARDGETSLKARLDRDIEKAKQVYVNVEGSNISTDSSVGYAKDVEILGNTIQDASNLADIRSVGDKVEGQELYEIPVLSVGKNLFDGELEIGGIDSKGLNYNSEQNCLRSDFIRIYGDCIAIRYDSNVGVYVYHYDINYTYLGYTSWSSGPNKATNLSEYPSTKYIRLKFTNTIDINIKTALYSVADTREYEPYIEDKLTILSPVQLEKVGDVADRIIEKDGVWGVEKNVGTVVLNGSEDWAIDKNNTTVLAMISTKVYGKNGDLVVSTINTRFQNFTGGELWVGDIEGVGLANTGSIKVNILKSKLSTQDVQGFKQWLQANNVTVKYQTATPVFIPLPHDQQVKLRTFANKTNISFLTEIEGTIKAQVPKSLGATVNTHTEQISNLNKELDRVKKLEESTVSTVETESDFTTVEATSGGYFEDVKLEGKTLVNLCAESGAKSNYYINSYKLNNIDASKEYTVRYTLSDVVKGNYTGVLSIEITDTANRGFKTVSFESGTFTYKIKPMEGRNEYKVFFWTHAVNNGQSYTVKDVMVLEGDHTQNPPNGYIEGLKSVGDGADEIVVSSVKGDGNLFDTSNIVQGCTEYKDNTLSVKPSNHISIVEHIRVVPDKTYYITPNNITWMITFLDCNKKWIGSSVKNPIEIPKDCYYVKIRTFDEYPGEFEFYSKNICFTDKADFTAFKHQSDKKRLLYYNEETQTWEKPILRQWDSIEKHSDGKYYYHQRSAEVVLNGSEEWSKVESGSNKPNSYLYTLPIANILSTSTALEIAKLVNDRFAVVSQNDGYNLDKESISVTSNKNLRIRLGLTKTSDVQGFKQWLQANNVTVVYQLAQEKVYECTNIDLITYANETNYIVESGAIAPKSILKVHNNISNVVKILQEKVSLLEDTVTDYMITQNRLMLASRYNADTVSFKVDVASYNNSFEYDNDLYELILNNILVGKDNYNREYIENLIIFYWMDFVISDEMYLTLFEIIEEQHNPKIIEAPIEE